MAIFRNRPDLLARFRNGDRAALGEVYDAYAEKVGALVRRSSHLGGGSARLGPQDFLDIVQEVFVKAFSPSGRGGYDGVRAYEPYLMMIARNMAVDWLRRRGRLVVLAPEVLEQLPAEGSPHEEEPPWDSPANLKVLETYLASLPPDLAALHRHRYQEGLTQEQAARALSLTRQNLRTLEERLRRGLRAALEQAKEPANQAEPPPARRVQR